MACVVPGCLHRSENIANFSFHRFPTDLDLRKQWIKNIKRGQEWSPTQYSRICSSHFEESCFRQGYNRKTLHSHAVPTIFINHPLSYKPKLTKKRKCIAKYDIDPTASTSTATNNEEQKFTKRRKCNAKYDIEPTTSTSTDIKDEEQATNDKEKITRATPKQSRTVQTEIEDKGGSVAEILKMSKLLKKYKNLAAKRGIKLRALQRKYSRLVQKKTDLETVIEILHEKMESEQFSIFKNSLDVDNELIIIETE